MNHKAYDSFGNITNESNTAAAADVIFGYTAREFDSETGLQYNRARYYDPATGRFISTDPIGFAGGDANLYRYVGNSPVEFSDPSGHSIFSNILKDVGGAFASIGFSGEFAGASVGNFAFSAQFGLAGLAIMGIGFAIDAVSGHSNHNAGDSGNGGGGGPGISVQVGGSPIFVNSPTSGSTAWPDTSGSRMQYVPGDIFGAPWPDTSADRMLQLPADILLEGSAFGGGGFSAFASNHMFHAEIPDGWHCSTALEQCATGSPVLDRSTARN